MHTLVEQFIEADDTNRERIFKDMLNTNPALTLQIPTSQLPNEFRDLLLVAMDENPEMHLQLLDQWLPNMTLLQAYECFMDGRSETQYSNPKDFYKLFSKYHDIHQLMPVELMFSYREFFDEEETVNYWNALSNILSKQHSYSFQYLPDDIVRVYSVLKQELLDFSKKQSTHLDLFVNKAPVLTELFLKHDHSQAWLYALKMNTDKNFDAFKQYVLRADAGAQKSLLYSSVEKKFYALTDVLLQSLPENNIPWAHLLRDAVKTKNRNFIKIVSTKHPEAFNQAQEFFTHWSMEKYNDYWMKIKAEHEQRHITKELGARINDVQRKNKSKI